MEKISVIIPCFNEEGAIASVIESFPRKELFQRGYNLEIIVIDNNSTDKTGTVARGAGARVIAEKKQGKGNAIRAGFYAISADTDYVVMIDGDDTYKASEILRLIEPLSSGFGDAIIGSRMAGKMKEGSMEGFNRLGNWLFSFLVRITYKVNVTDVLTGYFAWNRKAIIGLRSHLQSEDFAIEMEMITKMARLNLDIYSVPISYDPRVGDSSLRPIHDGLRILKTFLKQVNWNPSIKRIAFVSDAIYPYNKGGKERRLHEVTQGLVSESREVHIYTMKWWTGPKDIMLGDVHLHAISKRYDLYHEDRRSITQAILFSLACFKMIKEKFDFVDVDQMPFIPLITMRIVCWVKHKKMYATWHEVWGIDYWKQYLGTRGFIGWFSEYISFKLPDVIISNSVHTSQRLAQMGVKKKIKTVPLGVDMSSILSAPVSNVESDIIFVGRLLKNKNADTLVRAIAKLRRHKKDVSCIIIGDGPELKNLTKQVEDLKLEKNITLMNFIEDSTELYGIMKASKVYVLPSEREGFGLIVLEANTCGLPVLVYNHKDNAATSLIRPGGNGDLFKNEVELVQLLRKYLDDKTSEERIHYNENYDWSHTVELIQKEYAL